MKTMLRVYYSSDLVRPSMKVTTEPSARSSVDVLTEILAPHGLMLRAGFNDSWLVVRAPVPRPVARKTWRIGYSFLAVYRC